MSTSAPNLPTTSPSSKRSRGRVYFWAGIGLCLLGLVLAIIQFGLKYLFVPWYSPVLATLGAVLLFLSVAWRRSLPRIAALVLVTAFAGFQWYFLASMVKLPDYQGPAQPGKQLPQFRAMFADGQPFTEADLRDGSRRVMTFFRGRW
jgi:FtsH-binding integral membrane protein